MWNNTSDNPSGKGIPEFTGSPIVVYSSFRILLKMRKVLGLEGMIEYIENYVNVIGKDVPKLKLAVDGAEQYADVLAMARSMREGNPDKLDEDENNGHK